MQAAEFVVAADHIPVDENLREGAHPAAGAALLKGGVVVDGDHSVGQVQGAKQAQGPLAPGTPWQNGQLDSRAGAGCGLIQHADQQIDALLNQRAWFKVSSPYLAGSIGEAQVKVHAFRCDGAIEGDHFQITLQHGGFRFARALEGGSGEVAHHPQHEAVDALLTADLLEVETQIAAGVKL